MFPIAFRRPVSTAVVSVIIPVYKDLVGLRDTVQSVLACPVPQGTTLELIVVNDGADSGISDYCQAQKIVEVRIDPNKGSYHARNRGLEYSSGWAVGFVDADIIVDRLWLTNGILHLRQAAYVAGHIHVLRNGVSPTVADYQQLIDFNTEWHMASMHYGPTANVWMRRELIERIGGFNQTIFSGGDMEYGRRVYKQSPGSHLFARDVIVNHPPRSLSGLFAKSKRLAYGHNVIGSAVKLDQEFTLISSIRRNWGGGGRSRKLSWSVQALRILLFAHRVVFKLFYRISSKSVVFNVGVSTTPNVSCHDHRGTG